MNAIHGVPLRVALYARVSSDQQSQHQTIASQVAALKQRIVDDGHELQDELCFLDDGVSGSTLSRPALERLRDVAYSGGFQKLYVHSPDRLARRYAYQVLLVDELTKCGVQLEFSIGRLEQSQKMTYCCRCRECLLSTNEPRSWSEVVVENVTAPIVEVSMCCRERPIEFCKT